MLEIDNDDRALLVPELERLIQPLGPASRERRRLLELLAACDTGTIPDELLGALEQGLEAMLSSGRVREAQGPFEEQQLLRLYQRTPAGVRAREHFQQLNRSLQALAGQRLEGVSFALRLPGAYRLEIETEACRLVVDIDRQGVEVHQLEVSL